MFEARLLKAVDAAVRFCEEHFERVMNKWLQKSGCVLIIKIYNVCPL